MYLCTLQENICILGKKVGGWRYQYVVRFCNLMLDLSVIGSLIERRFLQTGFSPGSDNITCTICTSVLIGFHKHQFSEADPITLAGKYHFYFRFRVAQSAGAVEYTDCFSAEG